MKKVAMLAVLLFAGAAQALDPATGTLEVTATVAPICTVSTTAVNFGEYTGEELTASGSITVVCSKGEPFDIKLDRGGHENSGWRRVAYMGTANDDGNYLKYKLSKPDEMEWTDAAHGEASSDSALHAEGTGTVDGETFEVKGRLFGAAVNGFPAD